MKICHLSAFWPKRSAFTMYTDNLIRGMRAHQPERHLVVGELPAAPAHTVAYDCVPCFWPREDYVSKITAIVREAGSKLAIIQYANDVFGDDNRFIRLLQELGKLGVKTVVNSHSIYPERRRTGYRPGRTARAFDRAMAAEAALITVHTARMKSDLLSRGISDDKVVIIPHGSEPMAERDVLESRAHLGIPPDAKVVLFFGFIWMGKGIDFLLDVFAEVSRRVPEAFLYVGGHTRHRIWSFYVSYLRARMRLLGISGRSLLSGGYVPESEVPAVYSAADLVALPYRQDYSSVSGVVHQTAGIGKLLLCSRIAKFEEVGDEIDPSLVVDPRDRGAWADAMVRVLTDQVWAAELRKKIRAFAESTSWKNVGKLHVETYRRLLGETSPPLGAAREQG